MHHPEGSLNRAVADETVDLVKTVQEIVLRSNLKASLQPKDVRLAMSSYLEPEEAYGKPWETWL